MLVFLICSRWAIDYQRPQEDVTSQMSNVSGGQVGEWTVISFSIPCESQDQQDLPISGSHYLLFATGPVRDGDIDYHGDNKWVTGNLVHIRCASK